MKPSVLSAIILSFGQFFCQANNVKKFSYISSVLLATLMCSSYSFANIEDVMKFKENNVENAWSVDVFKSQGKHVIVSSVNGKVTHGDRLSIYFSDTDCGVGTLRARFLTELKHPEVDKLEKEMVSVNFGGSNIKVYISGVMEILNGLGHILFIDMGSMKIDDLKKFFRRNKQQDVSLTIQNDKNTNILKYLDRHKNTWSLNRLEKSLNKATVACKLNNN